MLSSNLSLILNYLQPIHSASNTPSSPISIREFVTNDSYLGLFDFWEAPLRELEELRRDGCLGGVIEKGIGGGKSYTVSILPLYDIYTLAYEEMVLGQDPRKRFGLAEETVIYAAVFTVTHKLAREIFRYMQAFASNCPWFRDHLPINPDLESELQFLDPTTRKVRYIAYPGHSRVSSSIGRGLYSFILDECNFFTVAESSGSSGKDYAEELYEQLDDRRRSRFGEYGSSLVISSRSTVHDFSSRLRTRLRSSSDADRYYLPEPKTTWADWPNSRTDTQRWRLFDQSKLRWATNPVPSTERTSTGLWVPETFWGSFETNPEAALRNLASLPGEALEPFIRRRDKIRPDYEMRNPVRKGVKPQDWMTTQSFDDLVDPDWFGFPEERYHFHIDLALKWDACGLVIARSSGVDQVALQKGETKPEKTALVDIEAFLCIRAGRGGEVSFERVREILYWLRHERGFRFGPSSYDGWQSKDSIQILERKGFVVETLSMDTAKEGLANYQTFKDALYEGRLFFPPAHGQRRDTSYDQLVRMAEDGDPAAIFQVELARLEVIGGKKVDHPKNGSKDMTDAACGAVVQATRFMRRAREY